MGLLKKIFRQRRRWPRAPPESSQFHESETTAQEQGSRNAPRRELVQVVLRDTMRKHGIPSDWIECRVLSVVTRNRMAGMHVQFIVGKQQSALLDYVHAFQDSFWQEMEKFEPRAREWLFSVAWQFDGPAPPAKRSMPRPSGWGDAQLSGWRHAAAGHRRGRAGVGPARALRDPRRGAQPAWGYVAGARRTGAGRQPQRPDWMVKPRGALHSRREAPAAMHEHHSFPHRP